VPRLDLVTVGEAFQDLIFVGLPHMPRRGEELKTTRFVSTVGGGAVITATAAARLGCGPRSSAASARKPSRACAPTRSCREPEARVGAARDHGRALGRARSQLRDLQRRQRSAAAAAAGRRRAPGARARPFRVCPRQLPRWTRIVERLRARGTTTSWDFGWNPLAAAAACIRGLVGSLDFVFVNEVEAAMYARTRRGASAIPFWQRAARNTIVKLGRRGSRWIAATRDLDGCGAPSAGRGHDRAQATRSTAASSSPCSVGRPPRECLRIGNFVGAQSTRAAGGLIGLPRRRELP
jgi:sugar/nucleoside kinase (ribokinase family)